MTLNTVFQCVKNIFFLSQKKIIFFTILNLNMILLSLPVMGGPLPVRVGKINVVLAWDILLSVVRLVTIVQQ